MTEDVFIIAIIFGTGAMITFLAMFYSLIKTWIKNRNSSSLSDKELQALQNDYRELRESVEKRLQNLEAIVTDEDFKALENEKSRILEKEEKPERLPKQSEQKNALDEIEYSDENEESANEQQSNRSSNLNNMLQN